MCRDDLLAEFSKRCNLRFVPPSASGSECAATTTRSLKRRRADIAQHQHAAIDIGEYHQERTWTAQAS
jgi:hypothetical protein